jgi:hypothetical protein
MTEERYLDPWLDRPREGDAAKQSQLVTSTTITTTQQQEQLAALQANNDWLVSKLHDAVNNGYGGTTHDEIDQHA